MVIGMWHPPCLYRQKNDVMTIPLRRLTLQCHLCWGLFRLCYDVIGCICPGALNQYILEASLPFCRANAINNGWNSEFHGRLIRILISILHAVGQDPVATHLARPAGSFLPDLIRMLKMWSWRNKTRDTCHICVWWLRYNAHMITDLQLMNLSRYICSGYVIYTQIWYAIYMYYVVDTFAEFWMQENRSFRGYVCTRNCKHSSKLYWASDLIGFLCLSKHCLQVIGHLILSLHCIFF